MVLRGAVYTSSSIVSTSTSFVLPVVLVGASESTTVSKKGHVVSLYYLSQDSMELPIVNGKH